MIPSYFKENWGFPFIAGFLLLLFSSALLLASGIASSAELLANYAYFVLLAGVLLQLVCFSINKKKNETDL
jgi:hypothetical protein